MSKCPRCGRFVTLRAYSYKKDCTYWPSVEIEFLHQCKNHKDSTILVHYVEYTGSGILIGNNKIILKDSVLIRYDIILESPEPMNLIFNEYLDKTHY